MKVSPSSKKELITKIEKLEEKIRLQNIEKRELRKSIRYFKKRVKALVLSRNKARDKGRDKVKEIKLLQSKLKRGGKPARHHYEVKLIGLCILLRVVGCCSYRSIPRILKVLEMCFDVPWEKIPCANSVENWVSKMGLFHMDNGVSRLKEKSEEVCLIMDENIRIGKEKMMLFLITPNEKQREKALNYEDVEVVYMCGKKSWTGEKIEKEVKKLMDEKGLKVDYIVSDEDGKLLKSSRLLGLDHVPDIGHVIGSCLRRTFKGNEDYNLISKLMILLQSKSMHQDLSYLRPPKQRTKARFMNFAPLVKWGVTMITRFDEINKEEQLFYREVLNHQPILYTLNCCMNISREISILLKTSGLSQSTLKEVKLQIAKLKEKLVEEDGEEIATRKKQKWIIPLIEKYLKDLESYVEKYEVFLGEKRLSYPVSSDVIESIFGKHKSIISKNGLVGMTKLDLELSVHCQSPDQIQNSIEIALEANYMTTLEEWREEHSSDNQSLKRNNFFAKRA